MSEISSDYYSIKSDLEAVLKQFIQTEEIRYQRTENSALHPNQNAEIFYNNQNIGFIGTLNPRIQSALDLPGPIQVFEIDISIIPEKSPAKYVKISKFPSIRRDISVLVDEKLPAIEVINAIKNTDSELLDNLELFDVYQGEGIDLGKKSCIGLDLSWIFQHSNG